MSEVRASNGDGREAFQSKLKINFYFDTNKKLTRQRQTYKRGSRSHRENKRRHTEANQYCSTGE